MVAGMLTAIQDFARDSFRIGAARSAGDDAGWRTHPRRSSRAPRALLAAVIRGHAPTHFRAELAPTLEADRGRSIRRPRRIQGDRLPVRPQPPADGSAAAGRGPGAGAGKAAAVAHLARARGGGRDRAGLRSPGLLAAAALAGHVDRLRDEPGIVVTDEGREKGRFVIRGLRDPLARDPASLLRAAGIDTDSDQRTLGAVRRLASRTSSSAGPTRALAAPAGCHAHSWRAIPWWRPVPHRRAGSVGRRQLAPALPGSAPGVAEPRDPRDLAELAPLVAQSGSAVGCCSPRGACGAGQRRRREIGP